jgi:gephyrin
VARITTGAPLPPGADAVIMVENTELIASSDDGTIEKRIKLLTSVKPGEDVRSIGSDIAKGDVVLESGVLLGPYEIGLAASIGMTSLNVFKTPKVAVLSTGNEVVDPGNDLKFGQIYDSNRYTLLSSLHKNGFDGIDIGIAKDT